MECSKVIEVDLGDAEHSAARIGIFAPGDGLDYSYTLFCSMLVPQAGPLLLSLVGHTAEHARG